MYVICTLFHLCDLSTVAQGTIPPHSPLLIQAGKDAVFRWTTENGNEVVAVSWGLKKDNRIYPQFIYVSKIIPAKNSKKYSFAGNLTIGRAWFILSNVLINETGDYAADIREKGQQAGILHAAHLQVSAEHFYEKGVMLTGTMRSNRKGIPKMIKGAKPKIQECIYANLQKTGYLCSELERKGLSKEALSYAIDRSPIWYG
ncbi:hypothetical protein AC249_AIPGENE28508 [Exaiptasia diaphana]|nr:hypothetical protein AC249_AIPGENE28508 [Exaiptasia diaphana]